ncbi:MAG TPA: right-handed parallel beta-helix repeat-containing protein [Acidobacteriota bacterium]|nr:right-handed parallel beta-helix repeat-containing protein [Acidobacteriota bacterium]
MKRVTPLVLSLGVVWAVSPARATTIRVPADQPTIQTGILAASSGDTVLVAAGTYVETLNFSGRSIHLLGESGPDVTQIEPAAPLTTILSIIGGETGTVSGFTFAGGSGSRVIDIRNGATPLVRANVFRDFGSTLQNAVVIGCQDADPTVSFNLFANNTSTSTVGIFSGSATILNNTFDHNTRGFFSLSGNGVARNNIVTSSDGYGVSGWFAGLDYNDVWNNTPDYGGGAVAGIHSISAAPRYCDPTMTVYTLATGSPCLGAGEGGTDIGTFGHGCTEPVPLPPIMMTIGIAVPGDSLHVTDHAPTISWVADDPGGYPQLQAEVEVGINADWTVAEMWDPAPFAGSLTSVAYAGAPLVDGSTYYVRVRVANGPYWSEWLSAPFRMNTEPNTPEPVAPDDEALVSVGCLELVVANSSDAEGDTLRYYFQIYSDPGLTSLLWSVLVDQEPGQTSSGPVTTLSPDGPYWWHSRAIDGHETSDWSPTRSFTVRNPMTLRVDADAPTIQAAIDLTCDGDTVLVAPGWYTENIDLQGKAITLSGEAGAQSTFLEPADPALPTILMISGEGSQTRLSGFTLAGGTGSYVVRVENGAQPLIRDCIFRNFTGTGSVIRCRYSSALITDNLFYDNPAAPCVYVYGATVTVLDNTFDGNLGGIRRISGTAIAKNNIVTSSLGCGVYGVYSELDYNCVINNNPDYDGGAAPGTYSISVDPLYCDTFTFDYTLAAISPCVGTGAGGVDMGAFGIGCDEPLISPPRVLRIAIGPADDSLHVVTPTPVIAWEYWDPQDLPLAQSEIEVGTDSDWDVAEMWQTQVVGSDTSVTYAGAPLLDGATYHVRVRVHNGDGWSPWVGTLFRMNSPPSAPEPSFPIDDTIVTGSCAELVVDNATDAEFDPLTYDFTVFSDSLLTVVVDVISDVPEGAGQTESGTIAGLSMLSRYWWRARTFDGHEYSEWSVVASFATPEHATAYVPADYATIQEAIDLAGLCGASIIHVAPGTYVENIDYRGLPLQIIADAGPEVTILMPADPATLLVRIADVTGDGAVLSGFTLLGGTTPTAVLIQGSSPVIENNIFRDYEGPTYDGYVVYCTNYADAIISYNLFVDNGSLGCIGISGTSTATITNNTFDRNQYGLVSQSTLPVALNNIITNTALSGVVGTWGEVDYNCTWGNGVDYAGTVSPGPNPIHADPQYCDPMTGDYTLAVTSPCVASGSGGVDVGAFGVGCDAPRPAVLTIGIAAPGDSLHVVDHSPDISWVYYDAEGQPLAQTEVEVGTDNDWSVAEMWQPAAIVGDAQSVVYDGAPLIDSETYYVRVRVFNGAYWSSWRSAAFRMNGMPSVPSLHTPIGGDSAAAGNLYLIAYNAADPDGDIVVYDFELYADFGLSTLIDSALGVPEQTDITASPLMEGVEPGLTYWWRARARDANEASAWSDPESFLCVATFFVVVPDQFPTIQGAIDVIADGTTIMVKPGTYIENIDFAGKEIRLLSEQGDAVTFLQPANSYVQTIRIGSGEAGVTELAGFTVTGGIAQSVLSIGSGCTPLIRDNVFRDHNSSVKNAVSISCSGGNPSIVDNLFYNNRSISCIGIFSGTATISGNTFDDNARGFFTISGQGTAVNNIVTNSEDYGIWGSFNPLDFNCVYHNNPDYDGGASPGSGAITADPLYCDAGARDYRIDPSSPCVGTGLGGVDMGALDVGCLPPCACACHADPQCDSATNVLDVVTAVNVAFRDATAEPDPLPECPRVRADVDCDGDCDILDVVRIVNVAFRSADPATQFCDPCEP